MHHTCPHCSAKFERWHDICPSCSREMFNRGWLMTLLMAIFRPRQSKVTTSTVRRRGGAGGLTISKSFSVGKPVDVKRSQRIVFDDGSGRQEWDNWDEVPEAIRAKITSIGAGGLSAALERSDGEAFTGEKRMVQSFEISREQQSSSTEETDADGFLNLQSSHTTKYRYTDSDGTVHETDRLENLPEHVQRMFRNLPGFEGE